MEREPNLLWSCTRSCGKTFLNVAGLRKHAHKHAYAGSNESDGQPHASLSQASLSPELPSLLQGHSNANDSTDPELTGNAINDAHSVVEVAVLPSFIQIPEHDPDPPTGGFDSELMQDEDLMRLGVVINKTHRFIICSACRLPYLPSIISSHLSKRHGLPPINEQMISRLISTHDLHTSRESVLEIWPTAIRAPYDGISIVDGEYCSECPYTSRPSTMKTHYTMHPDIAYSRRSVGAMQQIYLCSQFARYVRVNESLSDRVQQHAYAIWFHSRRDPEPHPVPADNGLTPTWLLRLGWKALLAGHAPGSVLPLILLPKQRFPLDWVANAIEAYLETMVQHLITLPNHVRGWIASVDG